MLEAANADPVSTISLKRSTQNLQLSTSWAGRLPHLWVNRCVSIEALRQPLSVVGPIGDKIVRRGERSDVPIATIQGMRPY
jgi:hypothetical protein